MSELFELKTQFMLGQYQSAINEGGRVKPKDEFGRIERDVFVYRAFIEQGKYHVVLDELKAENIPSPLKAVRALASFLSGKMTASEVTTQADEWLSDPDFAQDDMVLLVLAILYDRLDLTQKAMQCVFSNKLLEAYVFNVEEHNFALLTLMHPHPTLGHVISLATSPFLTLSA